MKTTLTPMMKQYFEIKEKAKDALLFYRLGDFYECFFEDAQIVSQLCDLILTSRSRDDAEKVPMCGVPFHAVNPYILKCIQAGYKVAIAEQIEDPQFAKGIVKRDIIKILTPGTMLEDYLDEKTSVTFATLDDCGLYYGCTWLDVASGLLRYMDIKKDEAELLSFLKSYNVREIVLYEDVLKAKLEALYRAHDFTITHIVLLEHQEVDWLGKDLPPFKRRGCHAILTYLKQTKVADNVYVLPCEIIQMKTSMRLDYTTLNHLEILWNQRTKTNDITLLSYLDRCKTAMGSRHLKDMLTHLSINKDVIENRLNQVEYLVNHYYLKEQISDELKHMYDLERIITKIAYGTLLPIDVVRMIKTCEAAQRMHALVKEIDVFKHVLCENLCVEQIQTLKLQFNPTPPTTFKEGEIFNDTVFSELDQLRSLSKNGSSWLLSFEAKERERTQIKNLKVGYNRVFGYYIEISKGQNHLVTEQFGYVRKQTLTNAERYISNELKEKEDELLSAYDKTIKFEEVMFLTIAASLREIMPALTGIVTMVKMIDVLVSFAHISSQSGFSRPVFHLGDHIIIKDSFHPLLREIKSSDKVIKNNWIVEEDKPIFILTGPNMGGKSTFMRQIAHLIIMAQMGCFVSAKRYESPVFDAIFTRIGASDDLIKGESTFMVEMNEANHALKYATGKSLILFDEIGRGTSTFDGMALAQAMIEYISQNVKAKTIFSTHYHELTALASQMNNITNLVTQVRETKENIEFLYRVEKGKALKSYGINVAKIAHLPQQIIERAQSILKQLEEKPAMIQSSLMLEVQENSKSKYIKLHEMIQEIDINNITPIKAITILDDLIKEASEIENE